MDKNRANKFKRNRKPKNKKYTSQLCYWLN